MAAATQSEPKTSTVSADYEVPTEGTIVTVLDADVKKSLSARLAKDNDGSALSDYEHTVTTEDYSAGHIVVHVTAKATAKK
jgi:hypothetical protein